MLASVKEVIGHYTAQEVIENQSKVSSEVKESMVMKMKDKPINITMVTISEQPSAKAEGFLSKHHYFDFLLHKILHLIPH